MSAAKKLEALSNGELAAMLAYAHAEVERRIGALLVDGDERMWPQVVFDAAKDVFGPSIFNSNGRTYKALDRRIRHAREVWNEKYGPLTPEQEEYATKLVVAAIRTGEGEQNKYPFVLHNLEQAVNHETVNEGFKKRAGEVSGAVQVQMRGVEE